MKGKIDDLVKNQNDSENLKEIPDVVIKNDETNKPNYNQQVIKT